MFGKLLKNDLKAQFFSVFPILIIMAVAIVGVEVWHYVGDSEAAKYVSGLIVSCVFLFSCLIMVIAVAMLYNRSMFDNEGYLTLSLPVKTGNLVMSKMLSGLIWISTPFILFIISLFVWVFQLMAEFEDEVEAGEMILSLFGAPSIDVILVYMLVFCIDLIISIILVVQCIYFGITVSHISPLSKLGKFGAIIFTFATFWILNEITDVIADILPLGVVINSDSYIFTDNVSRTMERMNSDAIGYNIVSSVCTLAASLGLNAPMVYFIKKKINV